MYVCLLIAQVSGLRHRVDCFSVGSEELAGGERYPVTSDHQVSHMETYVYMFVYIVCVSVYAL